MMVMTAKVDKKKIAVIFVGIVAVIAALVLLFGGDRQEIPSASTVSSNDDRVEFLSGFGWEVAASPVESGQVRIPAADGEVFLRYNSLQKSMGYDLSPYAGKTVMRYVYTVKNYPGATEPVYATVLISNNRVIGGDVTDTSVDGVMQSFQKPKG
jgi:hypothetical protein